MPSLLSCPNCAAVVVPEESGGFCPQCRLPLDESNIVTIGAADSHDVTRLAGTPDDSQAKAGRSPSASSGWLSSSGAIDHGRFAPGSLLGDRYRIIQRLGAGGMGEVYRADDLKLGQPVALKFLPADVDRDPARLTQLHTEVRLARQVSHPNVCRVYDVGEEGGQTFLSMEYVDGEDLASLLRRIGRFPEDRALVIARQICAGLAAAHERGVVHRDLKPANVMVDASGKVRITDFGLAGISGEAIRAGTPAYMAPEQLSGGEVDARSDIYALGLVLYEIFTGQRALDGKNLAEVIRKREQSGIVPLKALVKDLDPQIEGAVMRCLRPEPSARPSSALAVAAALPGGDPLAAALAAGETPSPEMVAAAGARDALHPAIGLSLVVVVVIGLVAYGAFSDRRSLYSRVPMQKSLDALSDRAREIAVSLGFPERSADFKRGLTINDAYLDHISRTDRSPSRWDVLGRNEVPVMLFWYRTSPAMLSPIAPEITPSFDDPPLTLPGMTSMVLDDRGRLVEFKAVPPRNDTPRPDGDKDPWPALFAAAGLKVEDFAQAQPSWIPPTYADRRSAWEGPLRGNAAIRVRVDAATYQGQPVFFKLRGPWVSPTQATEDTEGASSWVSGAAYGVFLLLIASTLALARSNLKAGRGDRRGAARVALFTLGTWLVAWLLAARHYSTIQAEFRSLLTFFAFALLNAGIVWLLYIALEPYVRRYWPPLLISWSRVLGGHFVDHRVGRDVLIGVAIGVAAAFLGLTFSVAPSLLGEPPMQPRASNLRFLLDARQAVGAVLMIIPNALQNAMMGAIMFVLGRVLCRSVWGGVVVLGLMLSVFIVDELGTERLWLALLFATAFVVPLVATMFYCGLLSLATGLFVMQAMSNAPMTLDFSQPHASGALWVVLAVLALTAFGFYASRAGQPLFGGLIHAD